MILVLGYRSSLTSYEDNKLDEILECKNIYCICQSFVMLMSGTGCKCAEYIDHCIIRTLEPVKCGAIMNSNPGLMYQPDL